MTVQRQTNLNNEQLSIVTSDPKMYYHALKEMNAAFLLESVFVMYRRQMLGCMTNPTFSMLAVVTTALEEALLRSTMVQRDNFFRWFQGLPELEGLQLEHMVRFAFHDETRAKMTEIETQHEPSHPSLSFVNITPKLDSNASGQLALPRACTSSLSPSSPLASCISYFDRIALFSALAMALTQVMRQ